mmetsp:Transcript_73830/g.225811  ORF Transcript_73830/g.225811 Transcript_73830/m.225811 type:complete len:222 (-) Transcript_73830:39-704(-)
MRCFWPSSGRASRIAFAEALPKAQCKAVLSRCDATVRRRNLLSSDTSPRIAATTSSWPWLAAQCRGGKPYNPPDTPRSLSFSFSSGMLLSSSNTNTCPFLAAHVRPVVPSSPHAIPKNVCVKSRSSRNTLKRSFTMCLAFIPDNNSPTVADLFCPMAAASSSSFGLLEPHARVLSGCCFSPKDLAIPRTPEGASQVLNTTKSIDMVHNAQAVELLSMGDFA